MPRQLRIILIAVAVPITVILWASVVFAMDRVSNGGEVLGTVSAVGVELGGLDQEEAHQALLDLETELSSLPITVEVADKTFTLLPSEVDFSIDVDQMLAEAMTNGREGGVTGQFGWWLGNLTGSDPAPVALTTGFSPEALNEVLDRWVIESIDNPAYEGSIAIVDGHVEASYPATGLGIDNEESAGLVAAALVDLERHPITLPTQLITPTRTSTELDAIVAGIEADAAGLIDGPITLTWLTPPIAVTLEQSLLEESLRARLIDPDTNEVELYFDPDPLLTYLLGIRSEIEQEPFDAQIIARHDEQITIIPGRSALIIDDLGVAPAVMQAARSATKAGVFPFEEGDQPDLTTAEAEALGVDGLLYRAVTFYPCCGDQTNLNRIQNIKRIAEEADGALVMPGETFSLNDHVGQRTIADGYARAGAIIGDVVQCCDHPANIGGGVSQFATTLYNAVFFSGVEDISHTPHTLHFTRYPEGREATLGFPGPDVVFRNNTDSAILIDTDADDTSVTVRFYGNNGGLEVEAGLSDRRNWVDPFDRLEPNETMDPAEEPVEIKKGAAGWTVTVFRYITHPDGERTTGTWVWTYAPFPRVLEVHPCMLPDDHKDHMARCPEGVPNVVGDTQGTATDRIVNGGWVVSVNEAGNGPDCTEDQNDRVINQRPAAGSFLVPDKTVTITICRWTEPPPEPDPEPDPDL